MIVLLWFIPIALAALLIAFLVFKWEEKVNKHMEEEIERNRSSNQISYDLIQVKFLKDSCLDSLQIEINHFLLELEEEGFDVCEIACEVTPLNGKLMYTAFVSYCRKG